MFGKKLTILSLISLFVVGAVLLGCEDDPAYEHRTILITSSLNGGMPYLSDVLDQGDSVYTDDGVTFKLADDFVAEDWIKVQFYNRPYSAIIDPCGGELGDFLVTGYDVEFVRVADGGPTPIPPGLPVAPFTGHTSILVPAQSMVEGYIVLVPFFEKNESPLVDLQYSASEILALATLTFRGHEIGSGREVEFTAGISVNFADPLEVEDID